MSLSKNEDTCLLSQELTVKEGKDQRWNPELIPKEEESCSFEKEHIKLIQRSGNLYCSTIDRTIDVRTPMECSDYLKEIGNDLWVIIRKLAENTKAMHFIGLLVETPDGMSFGDLKKKTGMDSNDINHTLLGLKNLGLIIQDKETKKYAITMYCAAFLATFRRFNTALEWLNESFKTGKKEKYTGRKDTYR